MKQIDQRSALMNKKKTSRCVKEGSGRCHVSRVSDGMILTLRTRLIYLLEKVIGNSSAYASVDLPLAARIHYFMLQKLFLLIHCNISPEKQFSETISDFSSPTPPFQSPSAAI